MKEFNFEEMSSIIYISKIVVPLLGHKRSNFYTKALVCVINKRHGVRIGTNFSLFSGRKICALLGAKDVPGAVLYHVYS